MRSSEPAVRARLIELGGAFGWLSAADKRAEYAQMIGDRYAFASLTAADVDFVCRLDRDGKLDGARQALPVSTAVADLGHAAVLACLGSAEERGRVVRALTSSQPADVQIAQVYLRDRPITDLSELRDVAADIGLMTDSQAQVRALDTLARHRISDPAALEEVTRLFPVAKSIDVQRAIAGILIRSDYQAVTRADLVRTLREHRLKSPDGRDLIDVLITRLQTTS
jgi:hypothetical protein